MTAHSQCWPVKFFVVCFYFAGPAALSAQELPIVRNVELQPLAAQVERAAQALELAGSPLTADQRQALKTALAEAEPAAAVEKIQGVLDPLCLAGVSVNPESRVKVQAGPAAKELIEQGWRVFLVKVHNEAGVTAPLRCKSPNAERIHDTDNSAEPPNPISRQDVVNRWLDVSLFNSAPLVERLSGLPLEYRVLELFSRDRGRREAKLAFDVGQGTQDLGFRNEVNLLFECQPSERVKLEVLDDDGAPTTAHFVFRDERDRAG
jgi:hypothetical protein